MEPTPPQPLRILLVEDNPRDADLVLRELRRAGYAPEVTRVENEPDFLAALQARFDLIISDYRLPGFDGMSAVEKVRSQGLDTPFILISGFLGEEAAIFSIKRGADDYVLKENLARLAPAVQAGLEAKRLRDEKRAAEEDRKRAYEQMQRMALVQNATLDALPAHIALLDQDGVIVNANAAWRRFAIANGFPGNNQGIGMNYLRVCEAAIEGCAKESSVTAEGIRRVLRGEIEVFSLEYPCHAPNQKRWFRLAVTPLHEGRPGGAVVSHVDITELKNAEADLAASRRRLELILSSIDEGIHGIDEHGSIIFENPAAQRMLGHAAEELTGQPAHEAVHHHRTDGTNYPIQDCPIEQTLRDGVIRRVANEVFFRADGTSFPVEYACSPIRTEDGAVHGAVVTFRDVTASRRAGEQLRLLRTCVSRLNDIVVITKAHPLTGPGPTLLYANEAFEQRTGYSAHEVFDQAPALLLGPRTDRNTLARVRDALLRWEPVREELIVYTKSGQELWLELDVVPVADGGESWTHWVAIGRDITERKQAESVVRISEERFRLLSKATNDAIWDWNLLTNKLWWNEGFETLFGFDRTKIEPTIESWTNRIHPEDLDATLADVHGAIDSGATTWTGEYRYQRIDGTYAFVVDRGYIIHDESGTPVRMIGGMTDLTERKRTEDQLREHAALLDKAKDAVLVLDLNHNILFWSKGAERLYGWSADEVRGRSVQDLLHRDSVAFLTATRITREKGEWVGELDQFSRHATRLTVEGRWTLIRDEKGAPRSVLAINTDVTEKKRVEAQFLRAQRMESLGTLAGGIAHDLNNVLAPILMSVDLLRFTCTDEESLGILDNVQRCAQRGADMVRQVLTFARGVDGRRVSIQLPRLLAELHKVAQDTFPKNIAIEIASTREPWSVSGDPTQLHQVFLNLLVNARDAMPQGGTITLRIDNAVLDETYTAMNPGSRSGPFVVVTVKDSGTGIAPEVIDRIFEPFFTTKQVGSGTGLGLSTAQAIVKSHGGFINLYSELGKGTRFRIYLPAETASQIAEDIPPDPPPLPRGGGEWVLVVDDEEPIRQTVQNTLERFGYRVLLASHGAEAIATYAQRSRDIAVVLTDMAMPVMDGPALIVALKAINPEVPIIASSGLTDNSGIAKVMAAGVNRFAQKPYTAAVILNLVHQAVHEAKAGGPKPGAANPKPPA